MSEDNTGTDGEADKTAGDQQDAETTEGGDGKSTEQLGEKGLKALQEERTKRQDAAKKLAAANARIKELEVGTDEAAKERHKVEQAAMAKANQRILRAEVLAAAAGKLDNPKLAARLLDLDQFQVSDDGEVDADAISEAIAQLLKENPGLAVQGTSRFQGTGDNGSRKKVPDKTLAEQIREAETAGDFKTARRLKAQLMVAPKTN